MAGDEDSFSDDNSTNSFAQRKGNDTDFGFEASYDSPARGGEVHHNKPYDEAIEVEGSDENVSTPDSSPTGSRASPVKTKSPLNAMDSPPSNRFAAPPNESGSGMQLATRPGSASSEETSSEESAAGGGEAKPMAGQYNAADYNNLNVSPEIKELFQYITRYKPHTVDLETRLKPFIPDFIPAVGEVDGYIKIPRPDFKECTLGLTKLDEPCLNPSDPTVLDLQLRSISKHSNIEPMEVRAIENAERNPKEIANWISRIDDLHRKKPPPNVQYGKKMPDIEKLMQVWPADFEDYIMNNPLPTADLDLSLEDYVKLIAVLLDVPVHSDHTDTLHVIFTLYSEFKNNPHFSPELRDQALDGQMQPNVAQIHDDHGMGM
jgi:intraflagellar transport protein 46